MKPIFNQNGTIQMMYRYTTIYANDFDKCSFDIYKIIRENCTPMGKPVSRKVIYNSAVTQELLDEMSQIGYMCPVCQDQGVIRNSEKPIYCVCELGQLAKKYFGEKKT